MLVPPLVFLPYITERVDGWMDDTLSGVCLYRGLEEEGVCLPKIWVVVFLFLFRPSFFGLNLLDRTALNMILGSHHHHPLTESSCLRLGRILLVLHCYGISYIAKARNNLIINCKS